MGGEVEGVPAGAAVAPGDALGRWLRSQRELRGISVFFVAARTKLAPERILALESGAQPLADDGRGRATARALARAIGADPDEAASLVGGAEPESRPPVRRSTRARLLRWAPGFATALALGLAGWLLFSWLAAQRDTEDGSVRYRTDYLGELLGGDGS